MDIPPILIVDIETTGLTPGVDRIVEFAWAVYAPNQQAIAAAGSMLHDWTIGASDDLRSAAIDAQQVHHIAESMCQRWGCDRDRFVAYIKEAIATARGRARSQWEPPVGGPGEEIETDIIFAAHNASFEARWLSHYIPAVGPWLCTCYDLQHRLIIGHDPTSRKLTHLMVDYGLVAVGRAHRALPDVLMAAELINAHATAGVLQQSIQQWVKPQYLVEVDGKTFDYNRKLKSLGFKWLRESRKWALRTSDPEAIQDELASARGLRISSIKLRGPIKLL